MKKFSRLSPFIKIGLLGGGAAGVAGLAYWQYTKQNAKAAELHPNIVNSKPGLQE